MFVVVIIVISVVLLITFIQLRLSKVSRVVNIFYFICDKGLQGLVWPLDVSLAVFESVYKHIAGTVQSNVLNDRLCFTI